MAEITLVKGEISALDRTWMSMPDGSSPGRSPCTRSTTFRSPGASIALAVSSTRELSTAWARMPAGGPLRLQWPLPRGDIAAGVVARQVQVWG